MNGSVSGDRFVIPQWLGFRRASQLREHSAFRTDSSRSSQPHPRSDAFTKSVDGFRAQPEPFIASELLGLAIVLGETEIAREVAQYVVTQPLLGSIAIAQANELLRPGASAQRPSKEEEQIAYLKRRLAQNPNDAIGWAERARLYTVLGQAEKAKASMLTALHLAPENRYIVRCAVRCFIHFDEWGAALNIAQRAFANNPDPLIFGPLISVATRIDKLPKRIKPHLSEALRSGDRFLFSEVIGAFATLELVNGEDQKSRKLFKEAWTDPTRPVIGHSQWVLRERLPGLAGEQHIDFRQSFEALAWLRQITLDFRASYRAANEWALEEPYARGAYVLGSSSACLAGDFITAEQIAEAGLRGNPKDSILINNLGFAQLQNGRHKLAEETLEPLRRHLDEDEQIAPAATFGMLRIAQGKIDEGEALYTKAITRALASKNKPLALRALLNYVYSSMTLTKTINIALLDGSGRALKEVGDAGCHGVASAISKKLKASDLRGSDESSKAAHQFIQMAAHARDAYLRAVQERFRGPPLVDNDEAKPAISAGASAREFLSLDEKSPRQKMWPL